MIAQKAATATEPTTPPSWRSIYPVHPCADTFPMMSDAEIDELAEDIKQHGLQQPVVLWEAPRVPRKPTAYFVLDGRNRLEALARLGVEIPAPDFPRLMVDLPGDGFACIFAIANDATHWRAAPVEHPAEFVIGANIRRRHLTKEQQAELIVKTVDAGQGTDRARVARSVRRGAKGRVAGSAKDPLLEQMLVEAQKHGISKRTVQNARAKLQGKAPAPRKPPTAEQLATLAEVSQRSEDIRQARAEHPEYFAVDEIFDVLTYASDQYETWADKAQLDLWPGTKTPVEWDALLNRLLIASSFCRRARTSTSSGADAATSSFGHYDDLPPLIETFFSTIESVIAAAPHFSQAEISKADQDTVKALIRDVYSRMQTTMNRITNSRLDRERTRKVKTA
jgi:hypothetical protein